MSDPLDGLEHYLPEAESSKPKEGTVWSNPCPKCRGTGRWGGGWGSVNRGGECFMCKGTGKLEFRTSPEHRQKARQARVARKERSAQENLDSFAETFPVAWKWIAAKEQAFPFAREMKLAIVKFGSLTERQMAAVERCVAKDAERIVAKEQREAAAPVVDLGRISEMFDTARAAGVGRPKLRLGGIVLSLAPATGRNAGAVYVKRRGSDTYLGKIIGGRYLASYDATQEDAAVIQATAADPRSQAVAYGKKFGVCSCCGRDLTDPESVAAGIGPICASKWGL